MLLTFLLHVIIDSYTFYSSCNNTVLVPKFPPTKCSCKPWISNMSHLLQLLQKKILSIAKWKMKPLTWQITIKGLNSFKEFQSKIESKPGKLEETILKVNCHYDTEYGSDNTDLVIFSFKSKHYVISNKNVL